MTYSESRQLKPEDENCLEGKVPGQIVQHQTEHSAFQEVEKSKDNPVSEPLDVVLMTGCLKGLERKISGDTPPDEV